VIFIEGCEMLSADAAQKLSRSLNLSKNIDGSVPCDVCCAKPYFGNCIVVLVFGDRPEGSEKTYMQTADYLRGAFYGFPDNTPARRDPPPYIAPATTSEAFDKFKDLEMAGEYSILLSYLTIEFSRLLINNRRLCDS
jgi:hypothetical protein